MKTITSRQFNKAVTLETKLWDLQRQIYDLSSEIEDKDSDIAEMIGSAGFELDEAKNKLNNAISMIKSKVL